MTWIVWLGLYAVAGTIVASIYNNKTHDDVVVAFFVGAVWPITIIWYAGAKFSRWVQ